MFTETKINSFSRAPLIVVSYIIFVRMKKGVLCLLSLLFSVITYAEKLEDRYVMKTINNGQMYFIVPFDIPPQTAKAKALSADITYLTTSDSLIMNLSVWSSDELMTDSIILTTKNKKIVVENFRTFFIEKDDKLWLHRYSLQYPLKDLTLFYANTEPFTMDIYSGSQHITYGYSIKQWKKEQVWMNQILHTIATNKRLYIH